VAHIFAIGDVVGQPMLAHKAMYEGKVAAEVTAGNNSFFDARAIPSVACTDPEVAWAEMTENKVRTAGLKYGKGVFPLGGQRPLALAWSRRGNDEAAVRRGDRPRHRLRHRRALHGRAHRRGGAGDRDGRRRG
jgi:hypothetical protein